VARGPGRALEPLVEAATTWTAPSQAAAREEAVAALVAMRDPDVSVRLTTALLARPEPLEDADVEVAARLAHATDAAPARTVEHLVGALGDGQAGERAGRLLVRLAPESVEPLVAALADEGKREQATRALGYSHDKRAVEPLCRLMVENQDPAVRRIAAWALGEIRDLAAVEALLLATDDADYEVRTEASRAFDRFGNVGMALALTALMPPAIESAPVAGEVTAGEPVEAEEAGAEPPAAGEPTAPGEPPAAEEPAPTGPPPPAEQPTVATRRPPVPGPRRPEPALRRLLRRRTRP
jgi:hypothetical protein